MDFPRSGEISVGIVFISCSIHDLLTSCRSCHWFQQLSHQLLCWICGIRQKCFAHWRAQLSSGSNWAVTPWYVSHGGKCFCRGCQLLGPRIEAQPLIWAGCVLYRVPSSHSLPFPMSQWNRDLLQCVICEQMQGSEEYHEDIHESMQTSWFHFSNYFLQQCEHQHLFSCFLWVFIQPRTLKVQQVYY